MRALGSHLDCLFGAEPAGAFVEVRWRLPDRPGMGQLWRPAERATSAIEPIREIGAKTDLYVGCAPRTRRYGGRDAIERSHVLWADVDTPEAIAALERFSPPPSMVVSSGSGRHAYWSVWPPAEVAEVEQANRRLAHALGADLAATDAARILRPPSTCNFKTGEPVRVELESLIPEVYAVREIVGDLPDPPTPRRPETPPSNWSGEGDPLLAVPPAVYVEALTGREVGSDGKVACPLHDDRTPSFHAYKSPEGGWYCFGCERGGTIYDLGAALYGIAPRGSGYQEVRRRLEAELLPALRRAAA